MALATRRAESVSGTMGTTGRREEPRIDPNDFGEPWPEKADKEKLILNFWPESRIPTPLSC